MMVVLRARKSRDVTESSAVERIAAMAPATCGVATEVPVRTLNSGLAHLFAAPIDVEIVSDPFAKNIVSGGVADPRFVVGII